MSRGDSLERQLRLLLLIDERRELGVQEAAERLGYTVRTVYRDLEVLQRVGIPLYQEKRGRRARWRVTDGYRHKVTLSLSWSEMLALTAGRELLAGLAGTVFHESALTALEKVRAALPPPLLRRVDSTAGKLSASSGTVHGYDGKRELLAALLVAVEQAETVVIGYRKLEAARAELKRIDPYHVHVQSGGVYLIGWSHERGAARIYLLDRVASVERTGHQFERRPEVEASAFLHGAFGPWDGKPVPVKLRFTKAVARWVAERNWHPSQQSQWRADGTLDVEMKVPLAPAFRAWLAGFGGEVAVLAPKELKEP